jgi:hypothetical protein
LIGFLEPVQNSRVPHHLFKFRFSFAAPSVSPLRFNTIWIQFNNKFTFNNYLKKRPGILQIGFSYLKTRF